MLQSIVIDADLLLRGVVPRWVLDISLGEMPAVRVGAGSEGISFGGVVEDEGGLFEGTALSLDGVEVDEDGLEEVPDGVDDVVLPVEGGPSDGVGVLVEDEGSDDGQAKERSKVSKLLSRKQAREHWEDGGAPGRTEREETYFMTAKPLARML